MLLKQNKKGLKTSNTKQLIIKFIGLIRKIKIVLTSLFAILLSLQLLAENSPFVRYPALNSDGSQLAFSFQGDIWSVSTNGGKAARLTIHEAYDGWPFWSKDDKNIAFSSNRFGNYDIFLMPKDG